MADYSDMNLVLYVASYGDDAEGALVDYQSLKELDDAVRLAPGLPEPYFERARIAHQGGQFKKAIADLSRALELRPEWAEALRLRGSAYAEANDPDSAHADLNEAIRLDPDHPGPRNDRGNVLSVKGQYQAALSPGEDALIKDSIAVFQVDRAGQINAQWHRLHLRQQFSNKVTTCGYDNTA